jgi:hypothetical protein
MSLILPLPKYRVLVRTDLPEWAQRSQTKMDRTTMLATSAAITAPVIVPIPIVIPGRSSLFQSVWPPALLVLGTVASVAWTALLGYGLVTLVRLAL